MNLTRIEWRFYRPDKNCRCIYCNTRQAEFEAKFGDYELPVCRECSELDETELMKAINGGQNG